MLGQRFPISGPSDTPTEERIAPFKDVAEVTCCHQMTMQTQQRPQKIRPRPFLDVARNSPRHADLTNRMQTRTTRPY
jgi:hypothetical protein